MKRLLVGLLLVVVLGCSNELDKETFKGKNGKEWMRLSEDSDPHTREIAASALGRMKATQAHKQVRKMMLDDDTGVQIRALQEGMKYATDSEVVAAMQSIASKCRNAVQAGEDDITFSMKPLIYDAYINAAQKVKTKASDVLPDLKMIRENLTKDYNDEVETVMLDKVIAFIKDE